MEVIKRYDLVELTMYDEYDPKEYVSIEVERDVDGMGFINVEDSTNELSLSARAWEVLIGKIQDIIAEHKLLEKTKE